MRPRRAIAALATFVVLVVSVAACSVPSDDQARAIDPARLAASASEKQSCTAPSVDAATIDARVYLVRQRGEPPDLTPVRRVLTAANEPTPFAVMNALVNCRVTEEDKRNGLANALPGDLQLLGVDPVAGRPGLYEVRLAGLAGSNGQKKDLDKLAVAQIFFTLTDPDVSETVRELRFTLAGRAIAVSTDNRTVGVNDTVRRDDFGTSVPVAGSVGTTTTPPTTVPVTTTAAPTTTRPATGASTTTVRPGTPTTRTP